MSQIMGEINTTTPDGTHYRLWLTMRAVATLQDEFGQDLAPIVNLREGDLPHFGACLRVVELALKRHHPDAGPDIADDLFSADPTLFGRLIQAAFPPSVAENSDAPAPKKTKAAGR
jgi:hypothetical protein